MAGISGKDRSNAHFRMMPSVIALTLVVVTAGCSSGSGVNRGSDYPSRSGRETAEPARLDLKMYRTGELASIAAFSRLSAGAR